MGAKSISKLASPHPHPGEHLREDWMPEFDVKAPTLAKRMGVARSTLQNVLDERSAVTAELALRLARVFNTSAQMWMNLQAEHDLSKAELALGKELKTVTPLRAAEQV
jgi:addiction module HigA family antidote